MISRFSALRCLIIALTSLLLLAALVLLLKQLSVREISPQQKIFHSLHIPKRSPDAQTGSEFSRHTADLARVDRQNAALRELLAGNIPPFLRSFKAITLSLPPGYQGTAWVMPDYLAIGSAEDFLRFPLTLEPSLIVAAAYGCTLPSPAMVDDIYRQAGIKLDPKPLPASDQMRSNEYSMLHHFLIQQQLAGFRLGDLVAGHKKDIVITTESRPDPEHVAIYGWHQPNGIPLQPLSRWHGSGYADYSHGTRLISDLFLLNGQVASITAIRQQPQAADPQLAAYFTNHHTLPLP